ncbi:cadmium-translocating P-type ATPase [Oscillospiraceae bacterium OttesenSCG-928-F05]|nr:cadmium-translocating P-type ATPase [Oscillospiraceae bacterium OttesenSCG-928-F05]
MAKRQKKILIRIIIAAVLFVAALFAPLEGYARLFLFLPAYLLAGYDVLWKALRGIFKGQVFDENFLMSIATVGAFCIGEYPEGVLVMVLYQVGELFQAYAVGRSRRSIADLMDIRPDYANIERDGQLVSVDPEEVAVGDVIVVKAGEQIPLDGVVIDGSSMLDTSALTGESVPRSIAAGGDAPSGCINLSGVLTIRVTRPFGESTVSKILDLVENASSKKAKTENFITKFARYYTPGVVITAALLAVLPPLILQDGSFSDWLYRALTFLVISCPCALVISVPLSFFGGIGGASKCGILVKGSNYLESLSRVDTVVFDKTGTLTRGTFDVTKVHAVDGDADALLANAAHAEAYSTHPIAESIRRAYGKTSDMSKLEDVNEIAGKGVSASVDGKSVFAGNARLMESIGVVPAETGGVGTVVHIAVDGVYSGCILIEDTLKEDAAEAIGALKSASKIQKTVMLTGDTERTAKEVSDALGLDAYYAGLLPGDKVEKVETLLASKPPKTTLAFVGDGINDAPVLSRADIGIAMGGLGSDAAIEAADIVIMDDKPSKINTAIGISRRTLGIVRQNIIFALGVKAFFLILGAFGIATMWEAVFADVGVSVIAILNAMRALNVKRFQKPAGETPTTPKRSGATA